MLNDGRVASVARRRNARNNVQDQDCVVYKPSSLTQHHDHCAERSEAHFKRRLRAVSEQK